MESIIFNGYHLGAGRCQIPLGYSLDSTARGTCSKDDKNKQIYYEEDQYNSEEDVPLTLDVTLHP